MRVLHLSTSDATGGAARSAHRLHQALTKREIDSHMLVQSRELSEARIHQQTSSIARALAAWRPLLDEIPVVPYRQRVPTYWSNAWFPSRIQHDIERLNPDIIHLHWINRGFIPIQTLSKLTRPMVWTLHDSWPFTGGCHLPKDCTRYKKTCGSCPLLRSENPKDLSFRILQRKQAALQQRPLEVICPSTWLTDQARSSSLFQSRNVATIPNSVDLKLFKTRPMAEARKHLDLPLNVPLILFGAMDALTDMNKGADLLMKALTDPWSETPSPELLIFGAPKNADVSSWGVPTRSMGILKNDEQLAMLYAAADAVVLPSREENLPNIAMEALACGTPVVAFRVGGLPDLVTHASTGWLAEPHDPKALRQGITWAIAKRNNAEIRKAARRHAEERYAPDQVASTYLDLYHRCYGSTK